MGRYSRIILTFFTLFLSVDAFCCTSVIISGSVRADGRPIMLKHRDSDELNNSTQWFRGPEYSFIGLVNSSSKGGEVWAGVNSTGFCIINTATYDFKDDDVPPEMMDKEGIVMYKALGICRNVSDFEHLLDTLPRPWGIEANFGIIDSEGNAAYFEVNNHKYIRYDAASEPEGYMVVTNFTRNGRVEDRKGVDRYEKACEIMRNMEISTADHSTLFNNISRSGDPILRSITASSIVFEGVAPGEDPSRTVMWTILGCPSTSIYVPLKVFGKDHIPSYMKKVRGKENSGICSESLVIKGIYNYIPGCPNECREVEKFVDSKFEAGMSACRYDRFAKKAYFKYKLMYKRKLPKVVYKLADFEKND